MSEPVAASERNRQAEIERLTDEATRILIAVEERRLFRKGGRFQIDQEEPPDRRTRESLIRRGFLVTVYGHDGHRLTLSGKAALDAEIAERVSERRRDDR